MTQLHVVQCHLLLQPQTPHTPARDTSHTLQQPHNGLSLVKEGRLGREEDLQVHTPGTRVSGDSEQFSEARTLCVCVCVFQGHGAESQRKLRLESTLNLILECFEQHAQASGAS